MCNNIHIVSTSIKQLFKIKRSLPGLWLTLSVDYYKNNNLFVMQAKQHKYTKTGSLLEARLDNDLMMAMISSKE